MKKIINISILLIIVVVGFFLRLQAIINTDVDTPVRADASEYLFYAYNIKHRLTYSREHPSTPQLHSDAVRTPGYPLFLSIFLDKDVSDLNFKNILFAQIILSTLTIFLTYFIFSALQENDTIPLLAALGVALSPHLITMNVYFLSETLFCFLIVASFYFYTRPQFQTSKGIAYCFGMILATAALTRPWLEYFIFILVVFWFFSNKPSRKTVILFSSIGFLAIISLWSIRNIITLGIVSDNSLTIGTLHHGLYPYFMYNYQPQSYGFPYRFDPNSNQISSSVNSVLMEILRRFNESPLEYLEWYFLGKPIELFSWSNNAQGWGDVFIYPVTRSPYFDISYFQFTHEIMRTIHPMVITLFVLSLFLVWLPAKILEVSSNSIFLGRCIALLLIYFIMVHCIAAPFPRYSIPMLPLIYGMAVFAMTIIVKRLFNSLCSK